MGKFLLFEFIVIVICMLLPTDMQQIAFVGINVGWVVLKIISFFSNNSQ